MPDIRTSIQIDAEADAIIRAEQQEFERREGTTLAYGRAVQRIVKLWALSRRRGSTITTNTDDDNGKAA